MNFDIRKFILWLFTLVTIASSASADNFEELLRGQAKKSGWLPAKDLYIPTDSNLKDVGKKIFESENISLNGNISCRTCHLDEFGSADGLPVAAATGEEDLMFEGSSSIVGMDRVRAGAKLLPRNTLPFWGRGGKGFNSFFWDGKIEFINGRVRSQFGSRPPSQDLLISAVHLPVVEIREMLNEDDGVDELRRESVEAASQVYQKITERLKMREPAATKELLELLDKKPAQLHFVDYARAIAAFIRDEFKVKSTKFERFILAKEKLTDKELRGGLIFYGKGRCSVCHSGPYFSDFQYHSVPIPQFGFGRNGFGVDYGRYNATFDPGDLMKFRTPPLLNVEKTAPYGHSGSLGKIQDVIGAHFDPLRYIDSQDIEPYARHEFARQISRADSVEIVSYLNDEEIEQVTEFLKSLSF